MARLKQMQRLAFLKQDHGGRGRTASYDFSELLLFVCAFELMDAGATTVDASRLIGLNRETCLAAIREAWAQRGASGASTVLALFPKALQSIGDGSSGLGPSPFFQVLEKPSTRGAIATAGSGGGLLLLPREVFERFVRAFTSDFQERLDQMFSSLRA